MGYATVAPSSQIEIYTSMMTSATITNAGSNIQLQDIIIPNFIGVLSQAYLDVFWYGYKNTAAVENDIEGGTTALSDGVNYWTAATFPIAVYVCPASLQEHAYFLMPGTNNLASHITSNATFHTWFRSISCISNNLILRALYTRMRLYFNVS
jgi:hypothetical protein